MNVLLAVAFGGLCWMGGLVGGALLYHWWWCRRWDREHAGCCR